MKRNGSALLIVLGMMAFMVVSAVAFSAYMRSARLPSSYVRRSGASRHLAKAALARAIDSVDRAIANNPHPGVGGESLSGVNKNIWLGRVLFATNQVPVNSSQTVPVLTLEGLAYIPPPLVNDVRYYSRRTPTAGWHQFGFDSGRYAFCAIDVSDYFDVNRMVAGKPRSSMPGRRISLSYLFEEGREHTSSGSGAAAWDTFMEKFRKRDDATLSFKYDTLVPLVSVADLNLALGVAGIGGFYSPFCKYVSPGSGEKDGFYDVSGETEYDVIRRMTFVTDSWFPGAGKPEEDGEEESDYDEIYDLTDPKCQPFTPQLLGGAGGPRSLNTTTIYQIMASGEKAKVRLLDSMPVMGLVSLFDYLDKNQVPVSLACPTVERTPMICGLKPNLTADFRLKLDEEEASKVRDDTGAELDPRTKTTNTREVYATYSYTIDPNFATSLAGLNIETLLLYPFAHDDGVSDTEFKIDGRTTFFFSPEDDPMKMRTNNSGNNEKLHFGRASDIEKKGVAPDDGTICVPITAQQKDFKIDNVSSEEDALVEVTLRSTMIAGSETTRKPFAKITFKWTQTWNDESGSYSNQTKPNNAEVVDAECGLPPLKSNGEPSGDYTSNANFLEKVKSGAKVKLNMALAVRVSNNSGKTVDLVPAHIRDDNTFNQVNNMNNFPDANMVAGDAFPVMRFDTGVTVTLSPEGLETARTTAMPATPDPQAVRIDDPRYNYAPESWYDAEGDISKQTWLDVNGSADRDGDIFMATSDQGYLQSIYELAFLPRLSDLVSPGGNPIRGYLKNPDDERAQFGQQADAMNRALMWNTYRPFATKAGEADDFEGLGFTSAGTGLKVNPYTDSTNILMAAFANTPVDWRMASTNNQDVTSIKTMDASTFNAKYAWNHYASESKFKWKDLEAVAGSFMEQVCPMGQRNSYGGGYTDWKKAWRNLGWRYDPSEPDMFCGVTLDSGTDLWGVDRKFLYGFWRDCFDVKQQLFLIFVRAEPLMMGGQGLSQSPPQLGARAVALVWRDPKKTKVSNNTDGADGGNIGYPHRTRILFYRQLD